MNELNLDVLMHIKQEQGDGSVAQISTSQMAEQLSQFHGDATAAKVRSSLSDLIDKGYVKFQQQIGGFQIVMCSITDSGRELLSSTGHVAKTAAAPVVELAPDWISEARDGALAASDLSDDERDELLASLDLVRETRERGRVLCALRTLREVGLPHGLVSEENVEQLSATITDL